MSLFMLGFTGTRRPLSPLQLEAITAAVEAAKPDCVVHGDCLGSDAVFHEAVRRYSSARVLILPGHDRAGNMPERAYCVGDETHDPRPYLERNRGIVAVSSVLLAMPASLERRGGTWYTIGEARRVGLDHIVVMPNGQVTIHYTDGGWPIQTDGFVLEMTDFLEALRTWHST